MMILLCCGGVFYYCVMASWGSILLCHGEVYYCVMGKYITVYYCVMTLRKYITVSWEEYITIMGPDGEYIIVMGECIAVMGSIL